MIRVLKKASFLIRTDRIHRNKLWVAFISFLLGYLTHLFTYREKIVIPIRHVENAVLSKNLKPDIFLVTFIFSSVGNFNKRQTIRETWAASLQSENEVLHFFVISCLNSNPEQQALIQSEQDKYNDLLIFNHLEDSFYLLTQKLLVSFGWLTDIPVLNELGESLTVKPFSNFKYVLKCDDDSFVRVNEIVKLLKKDFNHKKGENLYWGFFDGRARAKKSGKYKEDDWTICDYYLPYALGGGYVLAERLVRFVATNADLIKKYKSEDTSLGAWLSIYSDLYRVHEPRFDTEYISRGCHQSYLITHKHSETAMKNFHANLEHTSRLCQNEFRTRLSYDYNWHVPPSKCCVRNNPNIP